METFLAATEDVLVVKMKSEGKEPVEEKVVLNNAEPDARFRDIREEGTTQEGIRYLSREYNDTSVEIPTKAAAALLVNVAEDGSFTLEPGKSLTIIAAFSSNFKSADSIYTHLKEYSLHTYGNGFQKDNPHGDENWSTVPNTINEMMCMGHQGIVRLFPGWPKDKDASFHRIRVEGAFLVSASIKDGVVGEVTIVSEKWRPLTLLDPWTGKYIHLETVPGETYKFGPK